MNMSMGMTRFNLGFRTSMSLIDLIGYILISCWQMEIKMLNFWAQSINWFFKFFLLLSVGNNEIEK